MKTLDSLRKTSLRRRRQRLAWAALRTTAALALVLPAAQIAHAQTYTWQTGTSIFDWSDGNAWVGGSAPTPSATTALNFTLDTNTHLIASQFGTDHRGVRNDIADPFMLNSLTVATVGNASYYMTKGGMNFTGLNPSLTVTAGHISLVSVGTLIVGSTLHPDYSYYSIYGAGMSINTIGNASVTLGRRFVGDGNFTKIGTGKVVLSSNNIGDRLAYTGFNILQGTIVLSPYDSRYLDDDPSYVPSVFTPDNIQIASGAKLSAYGLTLHANRGIRLLGSGAILEATGKLAVVIPGSISGVGIDSGFQKTGAGVLELGGANTFTGITDLAEGTVKLGNSFALQNSTVNLGAGTGVLDLNGHATVTFGGLSGTRSLILFNNSLVLGRNDATYAGNLSGNGGVTITRGGTQTFTEHNDYAGDTVITQGGLKLTGNGEIPNSLVKIGANGWLETLGANNAIGDLAGAVGSRVFLNGGNLTLGSANGNTAFSGTISGAGSLTKVGTGGFSPTGDNTYTGRTIVNGGILAISKDANLGIVDSFDAAHLQLNGNATLLLVGTPELFANRGLQLSGTGNVIDRDNLNGGVTTFFNPISGSGEFTKTGVGAIHLRAEGTFGGLTNLNQGELRILDSNALQNSTVSLNGGSLHITNVGTATLGGLAGNGNLHQGSTFLRIGGNNQDTTYGGVLSGDGYLEKTGTGKTTLTGLSTRTFNVGITGGTLSISDDRNLGATPSSPLPFGIGINGGTLELNNAPSIHANRGISLGTTGATIKQLGETSVHSPISGSGKLTKDGTGTTVLHGEGTWDGGTEVHQGTLDVRTSAGLPHGTNLTIGNGALLKTNGQDFTLGALDGNGVLDSNPSPFIQGGGTVQVGSGDASGSFGGAVVLTGPGGKLVKIGAGTQEFSGTIDTAAGTEVEAGRLVLNGSATGGLTVKSGATLAGNAGMDTLSLESGGILSPGNSPGYIHTVGDFTWAGGSTINFDLGSSGDYILTESNLVKAGSGSYNFNFSTLGDFMDGTYNLVGFMSGTNFSASDFSYTGLPSGAHATFSIAAPYVSLTVRGVGAGASAPEPGTLAFALIGGTLIILKRKKN
jgi:fibronectin-binding autotransporter adhesin